MFVGDSIQVLGLGFGDAFDTDSYEGSVDYVRFDGLQVGGVLMIQGVYHKLTGFVVVLVEPVIYPDAVLADNSLTDSAASPVDLCISVGGGTARTSPGVYTHSVLFYSHGALSSSDEGRIVGGCTRFIGGSATLPCGAFIPISELGRAWGAL